MSGSVAPSNTTARTPQLARPSHAWLHMEALSLVRRGWPSMLRRIASPSTKTSSGSDTRCSERVLVVWSFTSVPE